MQEKSKSSRGELTTWYLARLRNIAGQNSLERKLTPLTLVETDKHLIQEIVANSQPGYESQLNEHLRSIREKNQNIRNSQSLLLLLICISMLSIVSVCLL